MEHTTIAVDLAKSVFEVARANRAGRVIERRRLTWGRFETFVDTLAAGTDAVMEALLVAQLELTPVRPT